MVNWLEEAFPGLARGGYAIRSERNKHYNCIAWAAGDTLRWWWPLPANVQEGFWPAGIAREETLAAFRLVFASLGSFLWTSTQDAEKFLPLKSIMRTQLASGSDDTSVACHPSRAGLGP